MAHNERKRRSRTRTLSVEGLESRNLQSQIQTVLSIPDFQFNDDNQHGPGVEHTAYSGCLGSRGGGRRR